MRTKAKKRSAEAKRKTEITQRQRVHDQLYSSLAKLEAALLIVADKARGPRLGPLTAASPVVLAPAQLSALSDAARSIRRARDLRGVR